MKTRMLVGTALAAACGVVILFAQLLFAQQGPAGPYTAAQAASGRTAYQTNCASCHAPDLSGREGPQLAGANFLTQWGDRTTGALINFMQSTMPPGAPPLSGDTYVNLAAFILDANSARAGNQPLTAALNVAIRSVASGQRAASIATAAQPAAQIGRAHV